jgi:hypothetical protein
LRTAIEIFAASATGMYCLGFCLSTFLESAAIAALIAIGVMTTAALTIDYRGPYSQSAGQLIIMASYMAALLIGAGGSIYYARRVAP